MCKVRSMTRAMFRFVLAFISVPMTRGAVNMSTPLNQVPFLMSHDVAMGYLGEDRLYTNSTILADRVIAWSKTQIGTVTDQLNCGARAFDMRPHVTLTEGLVMHHGGVIVYHLFRDMMQEMIDWAAQHPDELVIAEVVHCGGDTPELQERCDERARNVLIELGIPRIYKDFCPDALEGVNLGKAMEFGKLEGGGNVLAIWGECWVDNHDSTRNCRGYEFETAGVSRRYSCWVNGTKPDFAVEHIFAYLDAIHAAGPPADGRLWQMQALWQVSETSVLLGMADFSSILTDNVYSRLNRFVFENLTIGRWGVQGISGVNMLELDNVCDQGNNILLALNSESNISLSDYPDNVIIVNTGISDSILDGESILFPVVPDDFVAETFNDGNAIRRHHRSARWGNSNDIVNLLNANDEDKEKEYLMGVAGTCILLACIFVVWGLAILYFKYTKKVPWLAGEVPTTPLSSSTDSAKSGLVMKTNLHKLKVIRITVLTSGFLILLFSVLLIELGFDDVRDTLDAANEALPSLREVFEISQQATHAFCVQSNQTREAAQDYINSLVPNCVLTGEIFENLTGVNASDRNVTVDLIELNDTLSNTTFFYDAFASMNESLTDLVDDISSLEDTVDSLDHSVLFPLAIVFILLFDVVVISFMTCVFLVWRRQLPKLFNCFNTKFAIWLFLLLLFAAFLISMLALVGAIMSADFCIETPDNQFLRIINSSAPFDEFLEYYVRGCDSKIKPELIFDVFKLSEATMKRIDDIVTALLNVDPATVLCEDTNLVFDSLNVLHGEYKTFVDYVYRVAQEYNCAAINPIYALLAYDLACVNGFDSLSQTFGFMLAIAICSMTMITLRVAWYRPDDAQQETELLLVEDVQSEIEEEQEQAQKNPAEETSDEIDVDAASVDDEGDAALASNGGEVEAENDANGFTSKE